MHDTVPDAVLAALEWVQPRGLTMEYELRAGDHVVATLRFRSSFRSHATGQGPTGCWTFERAGILRRRVTVRACESDTTIAVFRSEGWRGGSVELPGGGRVRSRTSFWQSRLELRGEDDALLASFRTHGIWRLRVPVTVEPAAAAMPDLPLLLMLGCYLVVMMRRDAAAAAAG